jgi:hypothetical protein
LTHHAQGLIVFGLCLGLTTGSLMALGAIAPGASGAIEVGVLVAANAATTLLRYFLLRLWVFGPEARRAAGARAPAAGPDALQGLAPCPTPRPRPRAASKAARRA